MDRSSPPPTPSPPAGTNHLESGEGVAGSPHTWVVGAVPYLNARPLVHALEKSHDVRVIYDVPSNLPAMLDSSYAQAVLVSSVEALTRPAARIAAGASISSYGEVLSVRLFSKGLPQDIRSLALDANSMTSNVLARIILAERYGCEPETAPTSSGLHEALVVHDAAVLIGDRGMRADGAGLHVLDLGHEWTSMTGLPFVWALWVGGERLDENLAGILWEARRQGEAALDEIIEEEVSAGKWERALCERYLREVMSYDLGERDLEGLRRFGEMAARMGIVDIRWPSIIEPALAITG